jgi:hypothetical protein
MTRNTERNLPKLLGAFLLVLPKFTFRFGIQAIRFKAKARTAARIFRRELTNAGLDSTSIQRLTDSYLQSSDPFTFLRAFR